MAHRKAGGSAKNLRDSNPKYLGVKLFDGAPTRPGSVIVRQRGTRILPGQNVKVGRDHTLYAVAVGVVKFGTRRKVGHDNRTAKRKIVHVIPAAAVSS